jgi:hypothetical protein
MRSCVCVCVCVGFSLPVQLISFHNVQYEYFAFGACFNPVLLNCLQAVH